MGHTAKAPYKAEVIIIGAGVAGLAAAYTIAKAGHSVRVLEKLPLEVRRQPTVGVRIPPNLTTILNRWGVADKLKQLQPCYETTFLTMDTGEVKGYLGWYSEVIKETGGEFLLMPYHEFMELLYELAVSSGAKISYATDVREIGVQDSQRRPFVILDSGERVSADIIVGADGPKSNVRQYITKKDNFSTSMGVNWYSAILTREEMLNNTLGHWIDVAQWPIYIEENTLVMGYPMKHNSEYCLQVMLPDQDLKLDSEDRWDVIVPSTALDIPGWDHRIRQLCHTPKAYIKNKMLNPEIPEDWSDDSGRIVVIGEAAHSFMQYTNQNAALAVEDAEMLGFLLSKLHSQTQIPQLIGAFQELREKRCATVIATDLASVNVCLMPPGPARDARDVQMKLTMEAKAKGEIAKDEGSLRDQWEKVSTVFAYDATEVAEDWWLQLGRWGQAQTNGESELESTLMNLKIVDGVKVDKAVS